MRLSTGPPAQAGPERERSHVVLTAKVRHAADRAQARRTSMRSILLYFIGVPIPVILLLALCTHHF